MNLRFYMNLLLVLCSVVALSGQTVKFKIFGTVYNTDKKTVADWTVAILGDPASTTGIKLQTDANGNYEHTFEVVANSRQVFQVMVVDPCQNAPLIQKAVAFEGEERHDFVICAKNTGGGSPCDGKFEIIRHNDGWIELVASDVKEAKYFWDFGDGTTGEGQRVRHQYAKEGVYVVVLTIITPNCKSQFTAKVEVKGTVTPPKPKPAQFDNSCCGKVSITSAPLTNSSANSNTFVFNAGGDFRFSDVSWDFGDGTTGSGVETRHTYANTGRYLVVTTIKGEACTVILNTWIHVTDVVSPPPPRPCDIDFNFSTSDLSAKFLADFKGVRPDKISWDFGDGSSSSDAATSHTYAQAGEYKVTLSASINGVICQVTKVVKVGGRVNPPPSPCAADFKFTVSNLSVKFQADFRGNKPDKISWDFGDGSTSSDAATSHTYAAAGEYKVTLYVSINGVECHVTKVVKVGPRTTPPNKNGGIVIYEVSPSPAAAAVTVSIKSDVKERVTLVITDVSNTVLLKQEIDVEPGDNKVPLDVSALNPGVYVVTAYVNGRAISRAKFQKI